MLKRIGRVLLLLLIVVGIFVGIGAWALYGPTGGGSVGVKGYQRKDGTPVRPHQRKRPNTFILLPPSSDTAAP